MHLTSLSPDPLVGALVEVQQRLSEASSTEQLSFELAARLRKLGPITHAASLDVRGLGPGQFRLRYAFDLLDLSFSPEAIAARSLWDVPTPQVEVRTRREFAALADRAEPVLLRGVHDGSLLSSALPPTFDAVCVPVFSEGRVAEWVLLVIEAGAPVEPTLAAVLISSINSHSRLVQQFKLANRLAETSQRLDWQLQRLGELQRSILPPLPGPVEGLSIATHYSPCHAAGGDYYDCWRDADGTVHAMIADVSGHGPDAAVVMSMLRATLASHRMMNLPVAQSTQHLNRVMHEALPPGRFVTAQFLTIDPRTWLGSTLVAGHPPARVLRACGAVEPLGSATSLPLGIDPSMPEVGGSPFRLDAGDAVVLYTDGLTEARAPGGPMLGLAGLDGMLRESARADAPRILEEIVRKVDGYTRGLAPDDDRCIVVIRRDP
ncbi:MAG: serine/threonine-protein phosphatase [Phycisphaerales bacterium]|nr:serine/threonine-protein phosphatase [Phycisphaerales bacterium]